MKNVNGTLRVDGALKQQADAPFAEFDPNGTTLAAMDDAENDNTLYGPFETVADLMAALNA